MKKIIAAFALAAGLGVTVMGGAQAQTISSTQSGLYQVGIMETTNTLVPGVPGLYQYNYQATLTSTSSGIDVNTFNVDNIAGFNGVSGVSSQTGDVDFVPSGNTANSAAFQSLTGTAGLIEVGDTATFFVQSTLPPTATVSLVTNATNGNPNAGDLGGTGSSTGPGNPAVPEPGSFALLGMGLLPLGMIARRRLASKA